MVPMVIGKEAPGAKQTMKPKETVLALLLASAFLCGCGGGRSAQAPPEHLLPAAKVMSKGISFYQKGCYERSLEFLLRAHELYTAADDRAGAATALNNIGNAYRARGELPRALLFYDAAAGLFSEVSHAEGTSRAMVNRASALIEEGRLQEAQSALAAVRRRAGEKKPDVSWMLAHGILLLRKGSTGPAEDELRRALNRAGAEQPGAVSGIHYALSQLLLETGRYQEAADQASAALAQDRRAGAVRNTADDLVLLGKARNAMGRGADAAEAFRRAIRIYALLGDGEAVAEAAALLKASGEKSLHPLTVEFVERWLKQDLHSNICR